MKAGDARAAARNWVARVATRQPGFRGAYVSGSTVGLADDADLDPGSDVDIVVISADAEPGVKLGKFAYRGALLEVTALPWETFASADAVLGSYHLASGLRTDTVIADPSGELRALQRDVAARFGEEPWVRRRCEQARLRVGRGLASLDPRAPWHDLVTSWLFPTGVTTHLLLVAALRNPTVRLRYLRTREVLAAYGRPQVYGDLLDLLGCADMTPGRALHHVRALAPVFDAAAAVARTPFFFSSDISAPARRIAVDAAEEHVRRGNHRETVFWTVATFARCHTILAADAAPAVRDAHRPAFDAVLADLGIRSPDDILERAARVRAYLPRLWETTDSIIRANPAVTRK